MKRLLVVVACIVTITASVNAGLVEVDKDNYVYRTTTPGQDLYWYFNLSRTRNMTYAEQVTEIESLTVTIDAIGELNDWHMATETQISALLGTSGSTDQATLVADALFDLGFSLVDPIDAWYQNAFCGRYDEWSPFGGGSSYHEMAQVKQVYNQPTQFSSWYNYPFIAPTGKNNELFAWSCMVVPEPTTICMLGLGFLGLLRRRRG